MASVLRCSLSGDTECCYVGKESILITLGYHSALLKFASHAGKFCACPNSLTSVQFSYSVVSNSLQPHGLQHSRLPCPSSTPGASSNSCPSNQWCHPTSSSSVIPFSSCLQSFPASGSFLVSQFCGTYTQWNITQPLKRMHLNQF